MLTKEEVYKKLEEPGFFPEAPPYAHEILKMLGAHQGFDMDELAATIEKNPDIASFYLEQASRIRGRKFLYVKDAVLFLGAQSSRNLLAYYFASLIQGYRQAARSRKFNMQSYWAHVLGTSIASALLAQQLGHGDKVFRLFTYGLLHDLGIEVLDACFPKEIEEICVGLNQGMHQLVAEKTALGGLTHGELGGWLCRKWGFSDDITQIVEYHHTPHLAPEAEEELRILYVADTISSIHYGCLFNIQGRLNELDKRVLKSLNMKESDLDPIKTALKGKVEASRENYVIF